MSKVLVVDDKEENAYYLEALFRGHGWDVDVARHGEEALSKARQAPPDVLITDLLMPVMDGYSLLRHWKSDTQLGVVPVVVYTATYTQPEDEALALRLGADAFILKPAEPQAIMERVEDLARRGATPRQPTGDLVDRYRAYSETLIRKLEEKSLALEEKSRALEATNAQLREDIEARVAAQAALRASEQRLRMITEVMPQLVWTTNAAGENTFVNQRWVDTTGMSAEEAKGHGWASIVHPDDLPRVAAAFSASQRAATVFEVETRLRVREGTYRWWLVRALPISYGIEVTEWLGTCTDISEVRRSQEQLGVAREQLRQAQKLEAIGALAGGVAHDFNNLLSVILSYADLALESLPEGDAVRDDVEQIRQGGLRAAALTQQLLAFGRRQVLQPRIIDLGKVVASMDKLLRRLLGEGIELVLLASEKEQRVLADPTQIEQVVLNLAVNARDAMRGGGRLYIEVASADFDASSPERPLELSPGEYAKVVVTDTGTGMDEETRARIFEPFFTTKELGKGTGLGLSTVFGIVHQSHGCVTVDSAVGRGATFTVYLPRTEERPELASLVPPSARGPVGTETVLVVEDDDQVRAVTARILRQHGYHVLEARDGDEARRIEEEHVGAIHLLLTDVVMPRMSGRELASALALRRPDLRVLYVSGYAETSIVHHGVLDPDIAFLAKPLTPHALLEKVRDVLR